MGKLLEIFRPGRHTAMDGRTLEFPPAMLEECAAAYSEAIHGAPIVKGHPKHDDPAQGWAKSLVFKNGSLWADPHKVDPTFAEDVKAGRFGRISSAFYLPTSPGNPTPGKLYLRHIGFLGAMAPAVKGMQAPEFAELEDGVVVFGEWSDQLQVGILRRIRDLFIAKFGQEDAERAIPASDLDLLFSIATAPEPDADDSTPTAAPVYAEGAPAGAAPMSLLNPPAPVPEPTPEPVPEPTPVVPPTPAPEPVPAPVVEPVTEPTPAPVVTGPTQEELDAKALALKVKEDELAKREAALTGEKMGAFAESLVTEGRILPVHKDGLVHFLSHLDTTGTVQFAEDGEAVTKPSLDWLQSFLKGLPKVVTFSEVAGVEPVAPSAEFAAPAGFSVDADQLAIHDKAMAHSRATGCDYTTALKAIS